MYDSSNALLKEKGERDLTKKKHIREYVFHNIVEAESWKQPCPPLGEEEGKDAHYWIWRIG